jgi:sugar fermentation stimulation protein A
VEAEFLKREKRFFSYCKLPSGEEVVAHCPNPGSMKGNILPGSRAWLLDYGPGHLETGKKLRYKWVTVESKGIRVVVDTMSANPIVREALQAGKIAELAEYREVRPEFKVGASRFDFYLPGSPEAYVEVKSVSMGEGERGAFPDSVTERGQKHVRELTALAQSGKRAVLLFLLMREGGLSVRPAKEIDAEYDRVLREGVKLGLEVLVYGIKFQADGITIGAKGKMDWS